MSTNRECPGHGHNKDIYHANPLQCPEVREVREAQAALDTEPANAVEAHHKEVIRGLQAQLDAVKAVAADFQTRGDAIEAMDNNGSIYATRAEGRGIGYLEAARSIYKALEG